VTLKLKLHREPASTPESEPGANLRFPVRAARAMPTPSRAQPGRLRGQEDDVGEQEANVMRHPELVRQIEATLNRMQAGLDQLQEHVNSYKFPGVQDEERPRAA
jgi:hypothetical protein